MIGLQTERTHRRMIREAVDVEHPAERGQHGVVGDIVAIRAGLAEGSDRAKHERGVLAMENVPAEAQLIESADCEALDHHVSSTSQLKQHIGAARVLEVERQRSLVEIVEPEKQAAVA